MWSQLSSSVTFPSRRPRVNAKPELVVAIAWKPSASKTLADPASQAFGMTKGGPAWRARNASAFAIWSAIARDANRFLRNSGPMRGVGRA